MFIEVTGQSRKHMQESATENIHSQLLRSYFEQCGQKLILRENSLLELNQRFLEKHLERLGQSSSKDFNDCCTTEASIDYYCSEKVSTTRSKGRSAFSRKSKNCWDRQTKGSIADALQEIKEVCTEKTIFTAEQIFTQYHQINSQKTVTSFRELPRNNKENCSSCETHQTNLLVKTREFEDKVASLNTEISRLQFQCRQNQKVFEDFKRKEEEKIEAQKGLFGLCKDYLLDKEASLASKSVELRRIEGSIWEGLGAVIGRGGCGRCEVVGRVKEQIMEFRRHYQREYGKLQKWIQKCRKYL